MKQSVEWGFEMLNMAKALTLAFVWVPLIAAAQQPAQIPATSPTVSAIPRIIPTNEFAEVSLFVAPIISPDGRQILARVNVGGKEAIGIHSLVGDKSILLAIAKDHDLRWMRWAGNGHVLLSFARTVPWLDDEAVMTRLVSLDQELDSQASCIKTQKITEITYAIFINKLLLVRFRNEQVK